MINPSGIKVWTFCPDILNIISYRNGNEVYNRTAFANAVCSFLFLCHSSLVSFWVQIPCLHENLNSEGYEGSAIL